MPPRSSLTGAFVPGDGVDGDGVDGVQELDGVHGDLRSEAKCVQELDGVHGGPRSEAKCQAKLPFRESSKASASRPWLSERLSQRPRRILKWPPR